MLCPFSKVVWQQASIFYSLQIPWSGSSISNCFNRWFSTKSAPHVLVVHFSWQLWLERNRVLFEDARPSLQRVFFRILSSFKWNQFTSSDPPPRAILLDPAEGHTLAFFDGASQSNGSRCGAGGFFKTHQSRFTSWFINCGSGSNNKAELLGLWTTLTLTAVWSIDDLHVQGDSRVIIDWISNKCKLNAIHLEGWMQKNRNLLQRFSNINFLHIPRRYNRTADALSKRALSGVVGRLSIYHCDRGIETQAFGLPFLSPYLQSLGSDFRHGANYASDAGTVLQPNTSLYVTGISPFYLAVQYNQMLDFKVRVLDLLSKGKNLEYLPTPEVFSQALYTLDIGQNDFTSRLGEIGIQGVKQFLPQVASQIGETVKALYGEGARTIFVANLAPIGCFPSFLTELPHNQSDLDSYGCMISYNSAVVDYNNLLREKLEEVRKVLPDASVIYVDSHAIKLEIFTNPTKHGFKYGTKACCGTGGDYNFSPQVFCSQSKKLNGTVVTASACSDPSSYVSWDGVHNTDAANIYIANEILSGKYFQPPFPLSTLCDLQPIG